MKNSRLCIAVISCLLVSAFILSSMLMPGYILTLDMVWSPDMPLIWSDDEPNNLFLLKAIFHTLTTVFQSDAVQKLFLLGIFFFAFFIPWRYLPYIEDERARIFAAGLYALNPFVYTRILAGQWYVVLGYAFLPLFLHALFRFIEEPGRKNALRFALALTILGFASAHLLYFASFLSLAIMLVKCIALLKTDGGQTLRFIASSGLSLAVFLALNLFWIVPAVSREAPLESRFDETYHSAFSAASNGDTGVMRNVAALGGFWGEDLAWRNYFLWPQDSPLFWYAAFFVILLSALGLFILLRRSETRQGATLIAIIGSFAYIAALGLSDTPFRPMNGFLYEHVPFWSGLRDSQKLAAFVALAYAIFAGKGSEWLLRGTERRTEKAGAILGYALLIVPVVTGMYMWGGFQGQLSPVRYPDEWRAVKEVVKGMPEGEKVLVLPWHGYLSMDFAENRILANPTEVYFGRERIVSGRGVEFAGIGDQEYDPEYRSIDDLVRNAELLTEEELKKRLRELGIVAILIIANPAIPHSDEGLTHWDHFSYRNGTNGNDEEEPRTWKDMLGDTNEVFLSPSLILMKYR